MSASPSPLSRSSACEWLLVLLVAGNLAWTTLCLGGYRPETMVITSSLTALALVVCLVMRAAGLTGRPHPAGWLLLPFLGYAAANVLWVTPVPWLGWHDWFWWAQMITIFWVVLNGLRSRAARAALLATLLALGAVAAVLAGYQRLVRPDWLMLGRIQAAQFIGRSSGPFGIPNSLAALLLLLLPAAAAGAFRRGAGPGARLLFGGLTLLLAGGLVLTISRGAWLGLALALAAWPCFASGRHWAWRLGAAAAVVGGVLAAGAVLYHALPNVQERLDAFVREAGERTRPIMWRGAWRIFREHPLMGGGAGGFDVLFEKFRPERFQDDPQWAHNDYLNTLCDYGVVGFGLFFGMGGVIAWQCLRHPPGPRAEARAANGPAGFGRLDDAVVGQALAIGVLAFSLQLFVDFHFKIPALAMAFATITALLVAQFWPAPAAVEESASRRRAASGAAALGAATLTVLLMLPHYRSEAARYQVRRAIDAMALRPVSPEEESALLVRATAGFARATELDPGNAQAWADRAYAAAIWAHREPARAGALGREAEPFARKALALAPVVPEFWLRLGVTLDMQARWVEAGAAFNEALRLAPANASSWFYQSFHQSLQPANRAIAIATIATCLRLDPGNREAEALRQRLMLAH